MSSLNDLFSLINSKKISLGILVFLFLLALLYFLEGFAGYYFYDDISYARFAYQLQAGTFQISEDIFSHRWGIIVPTALFYKIGGVNDFTTRLLPFLSYLGILILLFLAFSKEKVLPCILLFTGLDFYTFFFSEKLYPDLPLAFTSLGALLILFQKTAKPWSPFAFVLLNFAAFLCKMTIVYLLPFYLLIFIQDFQKKRYREFWKQSIVLGGFLLLLYFGFYYWQIGNPWYRWQTIQEGHYESALSYYDKSLYQILARLTYQPILMLVESSMAISFIFALPIFFKIKWQDLRSSPISFFGGVAIGILLMFWFFSTSFRYYSPIGLQARHLLIAMPLVGILASFSLQNISKKSSSFIIIGFIFCAVYTFQIQNKIAWIYLLLVFLIMTYYFFQTQLARIGFGILIFLSLLIHPAYSFWKSNTQNYQAEKAAFEYLKKQNSDYTLFVDDRMLHGGDYFFAFKKPKTVKFVPREKLKNSSFQKNQAYFLLINTQDIQYNENWHRKSLEKDWELVWTDEKEVFLYSKKLINSNIHPY